MLTISLQNTPQFSPEPFFRHLLAFWSKFRNLQILYTVVSLAPYRATRALPNCNNGQSAATGRRSIWLLDQAALTSALFIWVLFKCWIGIRSKSDLMPGNIPSILLYCNVLYAHLYSASLSTMSFRSAPVVLNPERNERFCGKRKMMIDYQRVCWRRLQGKSISQRRTYGDKGSRLQWWVWFEIKLFKIWIWNQIVWFWFKNQSEEYEFDLKSNILKLKWFSWF